MPEVAWKPQEGPQEAAIRASCFDELFYGGAAGGGKSDFLLGDFLMDIGQGACWQGVIFRQSHPALEDLVLRSQEIFPQTGAEYKVGASQWVWPNGACLRFRHFESVFDFVKYQGHSFSYIGWDELPEWSTADCYNRMKSRLRGSASKKRIRSTGNPAGVGHQWVQAYFRIPEKMVTYRESEPFLADDSTKTWRLFIPSRVQDNKILMDSDPGYVDRLKGLGDEELVKAWLEGDWTAVVGAYFAGVWNKVDLVDSFDISDSWKLMAGLDYGEGAPTCWLEGALDYDRNLWIINEYYQGDLSATDHAIAISEQIESFPFTNKRPMITVADPSMFARRRLSKEGSSEPSVNSADKIFLEHQIYLSRGNNSRPNGDRLVRDVMAKGRLKIFKEWCPNLIRTLPILPRDEKKPDRVDTNAEDHAFDALRYLVVHTFSPSMSRSHKKVTSGGSLIDSLKPEEAYGGRYG